MDASLSYEVLFQKILEKWGKEQLFPQSGDRKARRDDIMTRFTLLTSDGSWSEDFDAFLQTDDIPLLIGIALSDDIHNTQRNINYLALAALRRYADPDMLPALIIWLAREALDEDGIAYEISDIFIKIGPPAVDVLLQFAQKTLIDDFKEVFFSHAAVTSMQHDQYRRSDIIVALKKTIEYRLKHRPVVDLTLLLLTLLDLRPIDELDFFREMYQPDKVDFGICGDWEDIEIELGLRETRSTPKPDYQKLSATFDQHLQAQRQALYHTYRVVEQRVLPAKIGVNDACPCGSGKKYKKCCLKKADNPFAR